MRSFYSLISLCLLSLSAYNTFTIFSAQTPPETHTFSNPSPPLNRPPNQENSSTRFQLESENRTAVYRPKRGRNQRRALEILRRPSENFKQRVSKFFDADCGPRFFMTWFSSVESFTEREVFSVESVFKAHPKGCLVVVSRSMDTREGAEIFTPFTERGLKVMPIAPDFNHLFGKTAARTWYNRLKHGNVKPGHISFGQNLSNLLRLVVLYRYGGIYLDTDVIVVKNFHQLRNVVGAQTINRATKEWSRLNNAVMVFDKGHPILLEFIEEFARTFNGNKWGHNGPYLVSRVVSRVNRDVGYNGVMVLPPEAFYPVGWGGVGCLFKGPKNRSHSRWVEGKVKEIRGKSFAVHLWNKRSKGLEVEKGSIVHGLMMSFSLLRNSSTLASLL